MTRFASLVNFIRIKRSISSISETGTASFFGSKS